MRPMRASRPLPAATAARVAAVIVPAAVVAAVLLASAPAHAQIFRCDTDSGVPLYQNAPGPRCKPMDLPAITTIPAPARPANGGAAPRPNAAAPQANAPATASPAGFPRVETATQRNRDAERRRILEDELRKEESRLASLRTEFNNGEPERRGEERTMYWKYLERVQQMKDDISRTEGAVASLKRELATLRD